MGRFEDHRREIARPRATGSGGARSDARTATRADSGQTPGGHRGGPRGPDAAARDGTPAADDAGTRVQNSALNSTLNSAPNLVLYGALDRIPDLAIARASDRGQAPEPWPRDPPPLFCFK